MIKKLLAGAVLTIAFLLNSQTTLAQEGQSITLSKIETVDDHVEVSLTSLDNYIVGGNRYILHIGGKYFQYSKHPMSDMKTITFLMTPEEFDVLTDGEEMVLVYGLYAGNTRQDGESDIQNGYEGLHWSAGKLNKSLKK